MVCYRRTACTRNGCNRAYVRNVYRECYWRGRENEAPVTSEIIEQRCDC